MKKGIVFLVLILLVAIVIENAPAEGILAFESLEYDTIPKKSITLSPIAQGIDEELIYEWVSADPDVAKVDKKGKVTGVSVGSTEITCTGSSESGEQYTAKCTIVVNAPVEKITPVQKKIEMPTANYFKLRDLFIFEPEDVSHVGFTVEISDSNMVHLYEDGTFVTTFYTGTCKLTIKAEDGSGKKASIQITVPPVYVREEEIVIDKNEPYILIYQENIGGYFYDIEGDVVEWDEVEKEEVAEQVKGDDFSEKLDVSFLKITPVKAGNGKIIFRENGKKKVIKIEVQHSAVVDNVSYPEMSVQHILHAEDTMIGEKMSISGVVFKVEEIENPEKPSFVAWAKNGDDYVAFTSSEKDTYLEGNSYTAFGTLEKITEYKTETGLVFDCPVINAIKIEMDK